MVDIVSQKYFQFIWPVHVHLKMDKLDLKKKKRHEKIIFFCIFLQSPHQVNMKNVVECQKEFFACFNALETRGQPLNFH